MSIPIRFAIAALLMLSALPAAAVPLVVVEVTVPEVNCVFDATCRVVMGRDTTGQLSLPGVGGEALLMSTSFPGQPGAPAAGKTGYEYWVDLTRTEGIGSLRCVVGLELDFGPIARLPYKKTTPPVAADVYVVVGGGLGTIGLAAAEQDSGIVIFKFAKPVCAGSAEALGDSSFIFGLAGFAGPKRIKAVVELTGGRNVLAEVRTQTH